MATHSSILAWRIPWTREPGGLQGGPWGCRVRHNWRDWARMRTLTGQMMVSTRFEPSTLVGLVTCHFTGSWLTMSNSAGVESYYSSSTSHTLLCRRTYPETLFNCRFCFSRSKLDQRGSTLNKFPNNINVSTSIIGPIPCNTVLLSHRPLTNENLIMALTHTFWISLEALQSRGNQSPWLWGSNKWRDAAVTTL